MFKIFICKNYKIFLYLIIIEYKNTFFQEHTLVKLSTVSEPVLLDQLDAVNLDRMPLWWYQGAESVHQAPSTGVPSLRTNVSTVGAPG